MTSRQVQNRLEVLSARLARTTFEASGSSFHATISCGVAEYSAGDTVKSLAQHADAALYDAKRQGRNRVVSHEKPTLRDMMDQ